MSDSLESLQRRIKGAGELQSVARTMKTLAAASIGQYEKACRAVADYNRGVELGLAACFRQIGRPAAFAGPAKAKTIGAVIFGSDVGLVGQFNETIAAHAAKTLQPLPGHKAIYAVGERVLERLAEAGLPPIKRFALPNSVAGIGPLVGQLLIETDALRARDENAEVWIFHHRPGVGAASEPTGQRLLPLDQAWRRQIAGIRWPTPNSPELLNAAGPTLLALVREYLFVSLFRAGAESLASENASRLAAMQRAEKNIAEQLGELNQTFHRQRQSRIDEELFDLVSGLEVLAPRRPGGGRPYRAAVSAARPAADYTARLIPHHTG